MHWILFFVSNILHLELRKLAMQKYQQSHTKSSPIEVCSFSPRSGKNQSSKRENVWTITALIYLNTTKKKGCLTSILAKKDWVGSLDFLFSLTSSPGGFQNISPLQCQRGANRKPGDLFPLGGIKCCPLKNITYKTLGKNIGWNLQDLVIG